MRFVRKIEVVGKSGSDFHRSRMRSEIRITREALPRNFGRSIALEFLSGTKLHRRSQNNSNHIWNMKTYDDIVEA